MNSTPLPPLASRLSQLRPSPIRSMMNRVSALTQAGKPVIPLVAGEPDCDTPEPIKRATIRALEANFTHYGPNRGVLELREAIARQLARETGVHYDPESEIILTAGVAEGIHDALAALVEPGDECLVFTPAFVSYQNLIRMLGGRVVELPLSRENGFQVDLQAVKARITPRTKLMVINTPANPTGALMEQPALAGLAQLAQQHNLYVLSDEIYRRLTYGDARFHSMASLPGMRSRTVVLDGFSKTYAMTGWRLGFMAAPRPLADGLLSVHQYATTCAPTFLQVGLARALEDAETERQVQAMLARFAQRRSLMISGLSAVPEIEFCPPTGAFYLFADVSRTGLSGDEFCRRLLDEQLVGTVPGSAFGSQCGQYVRLSFATSEQHIEEGIERIAAFVRGL